MGHSPAAVPTAAALPALSLRASVSAAAEALLAPLDAARAALLRALGPLARPFILSRELRVSANATLIVLGALVGTLLAPLWLVVLGPVVWGVPHVLADVRYLIARPGLHRRPAVLLAGGLPLIGTLAGYGLRATLIGVAGALLVARGVSPARRAAGLALTAALSAVAWRVPYAADLTFSHVHHFIGVGAWYLWRRRDARLHWVPLALLALASVALLAGLGDATVAGPHGRATPLPGIDLAWYVPRYAPVANATLGARLVLLFTFAQAVHYGTWLRLVPEEDRAQHTPRSFRQSFRALGADLGVLLVALAAVFALGITAWATLDLTRAREVYFQFAALHAHVELIALAVLWAERTRVRA